MKKIIASIVVLILGGTIALAPLATTPVYATSGADCTCENGNKGHEIDAAILTGICDCGGGEAIKHILSLVVRIMTVLIGILAAIGVAIAGVQYVTAGANEERTRKAKRHIFEIVIGIAAYVLIFVVLQWLIPDFTPFG